MQDNKRSLKQGENPKTKGYHSLVRDSITASDKSAKETFKDKGFRDEWRALYAASGVLRAIVSVGSFATLTACISWGLSFRLLPALSWGIAVGVALILEGSKGFLWTKSAKYILKYKSAPALLIGGAALLTTLSLLGGIGGALTAPSSYSEPSDRLDQDSALAMVDLVELEYLEQLNKLDQQAGDISGAIASTKSNSTKRTLAAAQQGINQERTKVAANLEQHREQQAKKQEEAAKKQEADKQAAQDEQLKETSQRRAIAVFLAVLFDLLQIICFIWGVYYLWRVYAEGVAYSETPQDAPQEPQTQNGNDAARQTLNVQTEAYQPRPIGFVQGGSSVTPNVTADQTPNVTALHAHTQERTAGHQTPNVRDARQPTAPHGKITNPQRERHCNWCGSVYKYKNSNSKFCGPKCRGKMHRYSNQTGADE